MYNWLRKLVNSVTEPITGESVPSPDLDIDQPEWTPWIYTTMTDDMNESSMDTVFISCDGTISNTYDKIYTTTNFNPDHVFFGKNGKEVVRLDSDGNVIWTDDNITEAAAAFSTVLAASSAQLKRNIYDDVLNELLVIAEPTGSVSVADLTTLIRSRVN